MKPVYVLPNLLTTGSLFSGLCSIIASSHGDYRVACYLILLSAILDAIDGPVARLTRSTSPFGLEYDSLADLVAFGVAPAFLMYGQLEVINAALPLPDWAPRMAIGVCALYAISGAIRLARFNTQASGEEKTHFTGMPIPAAAGTVVSTYLVIDQYLPEYETLGLHRALLVLMLILSYLMVSTYPFPSLKGMKRRLGMSINGFITVTFCIFLVLAFKEHLPIIAFLVFISYIVMAVTRVIRTKRQLRRFSPGTSISFDDEDGEETEDPE